VERQQQQLDGELDRKLVMPRLLKAAHSAAASLIASKIRPDQPTEAVVSHLYTSAHIGTHS
jgi:hypothetical protein